MVIDDHLKHGDSIHQKGLQTFSRLLHYKLNKCLNMKNSIMAFSCLFLFSCAGNKQNESANDSTSTAAPAVRQDTTLCFHRLEGLKNQDTTSITLRFNGDEVNGELNHLPYEKDSRKGTFKGNRKGDTIRALWTFMQEGMNDTLSVEFKLSGDELLQKTYGVDTSTGRQKLTDTSTFAHRYTRVECK